MAGAAALEPGLGGKFADEGDVVFLGKGQDTVVLQQHHAFTGDLSREQMVSFLVPGSLGLGIFQIAVVDGQDPLHGLIHNRFLQNALLNGFQHLPVVNTAGGGHFQIQTRCNTLHTVGNSAPVGDHIALEAPLVPEHFRQEPGIFRSVNAVDPVVGAHHRPGLGLLHGGFKGREVDLPEGSLVHIGGGTHAPVLLTVGGEMLDGGAHVFALDAVDEGCCHLTGQIRIFGEVFKVPAAEGAALDVHGGAQHHAELLVLAAVADGLAHAVDHLLVKGGGSGAGGRHADGCDGVVHAQVVAGIILLAQTVGAVGDHTGGDAQTVDGFGVPEVQAGQKAALFFQRHLGDKSFDVHGVFSFFIVKQPETAGPPRLRRDFQGYP